MRVMRLELFLKVWSGRAVHGLLKEGLKCLQILGEAKPKLTWKSIDLSCPPNGFNICVKDWCQALSFSGLKGSNVWQGRTGFTTK